MTAFADNSPFGPSEQPEHGDNWRSIATLSCALKRSIVMGCPDLLTAMCRYERMIFAQGGVMIYEAIDGTPRDSLPHRQNMPAEWSARFWTLLGLCNGETHLIERVVDILASVELEADQPSVEAMLCIGEDLVIMAKHYAGRLGA